MRTPLPRRGFLRIGVLSAVSAGIALSGIRIGLAQTADGGDRKFDIPLSAQSEPTFWFKPETFKPYVGGYFEAPSASGRMIELQLVSLKIFDSSKNALQLTKRAGETETFSLLFEAAAQLPLFTSIHRISHPSLGEFDLFLTAREGESGELFYEAVINHIR